MCDADRGYFPCPLLKLAIIKDYFSWRSQIIADMLTLYRSINDIMLTICEREHFNGIFYSVDSPTVPCRAEAVKPYPTLPGRVGQLLPTPEKALQ
jgi:hypothetical protein